MHAVMFFVLIFERIKRKKEGEKRWMIRMGTKKWECKEEQEEKKSKKAERI